MNRDQILEYHKRHAWMPFTQMKLAPDPLLIKKALGVHLTSDRGEQIIDAVGSWWVNIHGHNHPRITAAVKEQLERIDHVMYAGISHEGAALLGAKLSESTGHRLPRVFYSDNGSTAVEIALKMAFQYFTNAGRSEKSGFVALEGGYHGDTIGTMSVGTRSVFHRMYEPLLFPVYHAKSPSCPFEFFGDEAKEEEGIREALTDMENRLKEKGDRTAAVIVEPLIQGAGGMIFYPPLYLKRLRELCDRYEVFLIADEVFTGFGRTGTMYAFQQAGVWPDIMALSKGLSGGYFPFAATLSTEKVYEGFLSDDRNHTLFHGHSMTANASGCAASLASLELFESEHRMEDVKRIDRKHKSNLEALRAGPLGGRMKEARFMGSVAAVELDLPGGYTGDFGWNFMTRAIQKGALLRPLGPVIYLAPPYVITDGELDRVYSILEETLREVL